MKMTESTLQAIETHAEETYPQECFGFLLGKSMADDWVRQSVRGKNIHRTPHRNFKMDAGDFAKVAHSAENQGLDVLGVYHSHPDFPAVPSQKDLDAAVDAWLYAIVSVLDGKPMDTQLWKIASDKPRRFVSVPMEIERK